LLGNTNRVLQNAVHDLLLYSYIHSFAIDQASALRCSAGWGGLCFSSGTCGWLIRLLLCVRWSGGLRHGLLSGQWSRVGKACGLWVIRLLGKGLLCSRPLLKLPPPPGLPCMILPGMIGQSQLRAGTKSALIILFSLFASWKDAHGTFLNYHQDLHQTTSSTF
jgi:hypothetical protein